MRSPFKLTFVLTVTLPVPLLAAETGDFDGDGRLSIGDVIYFHDHVPSSPESLDDVIAALPPESLQGFLDDLCYKTISECPKSFFFWAEQFVPPSVYLESLRRVVPGSYPHWHGVWPDPNLIANPLPTSDAVKVELLPMTASGGDDHFVDVKFRLIASEPIRAFSLVLESGGLLRPIQLDLLDSPAPWNQSAWNGWRVFEDWGYWGFSNEVVLHFSPQTFLITGGRWVVQYNLPSARPPFLEAGEHVLSLRARLPKGLKAGSHPVSVLPASEVFLASGKVISPQAVNESSILVEREITGGWDEGIPPLRFDPIQKKILGKIEFRIADSQGRPVVPGLPAAEAFPGEEFKLRVQMKTETPLNFFEFKIRWYNLDLRCAGLTSPLKQVNLFRNPEDGLLYEPGEYTPQCGVGPSGAGGVTYHLAGGTASSVGINYPLRPLEYFKPLNEWVDLVEYAFKIDPAAAGGQEIPLLFYFDSLNDSFFAPAFEPYSATRWCGCDAYLDQWAYEDIVFENPTILVLGDQEPSEVPNLGIRMRVGDLVAAGSPGDLVEVPLFASTKKPVSVLRWALEINPEAILATAFDVNALLANGWNAHATISRGTLSVNVGGAVCGGKPNCSVFGPASVSFFQTKDPFALIDIVPGVLQPYHNEETEVGKLVVEVKEVALGSETVIGPGKVPVGDPGAEVIEESGGIGLWNPDAGKFGPPTQFIAGKIRFVGFLRGDANADGALDLSDAITTLSFLFLGGEAPACQDGSDADDNGQLEITDPVLHLGVLFLGAGELPPPYPACGLDSTADDLGCRETGCWK